MTDRARVPIYGAPLSRQESRDRERVAPNDLVDRVEAAGVSGTWYRDGAAVPHLHLRRPLRAPHELVWDVAEPGFDSTYPDRPGRRSSHAAAPRFLDHVTVAAADVRDSRVGTRR